MNVEPILAPRAASILYGLARGQVEGGDSHWLLPANICSVVPLALLAARASIEFVDIDPTTWCIDTSLAAARLADRSRPVTAILYVRTYGVSESAAADLRTLRAAAPSETLLIDDRCCDVPILDAEALGPACADAVLFSTGNSKIADLGGGGFGFFFGAPNYRPYAGPADPALRNALARLCDRGGTEGTADDRRAVLGNPAWLAGVEPESWASYRRAISKRLAEVLPHKARLNAIYRDALGFLKPRDDGQIWRFNVEVANRNAVLDSIFSAGLFASAHYAPSAADFGGGHYEAADKLAGGILNLFNGPEFDIARARAIVAIILRHTGPRMHDHLHEDRECRS